MKQLINLLLFTTLFNSSFSFKAKATNDISFHSSSFSLTEEEPLEKTLDDSRILMLRELKARVNYQKNRDDISDRFFKRTLDVDVDADVEDESLYLIFEEGEKEESLLEIEKYKNEWGPTFAAPQVIRSILNFASKIYSITSILEIEAGFGLNETFAKGINPGILWKCYNLELNHSTYKHPWFKETTSFYPPKKISELNETINTYMDHSMLALFYPTKKPEETGITQATQEFLKRGGEYLILVGDQNLVGTRCFYGVLFSEFDLIFSKEIRGFEEQTRRGSIAIRKNSGFGEEITGESLSIYKRKERRGF